MAEAEKYPMPDSTNGEWDHVSCGLCHTPMELRPRPTRGGEAWFAVCAHAPELNGPKPRPELFVLCDKDNNLLPGEHWA